jgi:hypothetical protein
MDGLKYGEHQLDDIWRCVSQSKVYGHGSCKTHYIEKSKKSALPEVRTKESRIFKSHN